MPTPWENEQWYLNALYDDHIFETVVGTNFSVTTTTGTILAANTSRKYAAIVNDSDSVVYLALGGTAAVNKGIRLNAGGGSFEIDWLNLYRGQVQGISAGTAKVVTTLEGT